MGSQISTPSTPDIRQLFPATQAGGLRRNDGSIVPIPEGMTPTITPMPTIPRKDPRTTPLAQNEFGFNKRFANQEAFDSAYQDYLNTYKDDYSQYQKGTGRKLIPSEGGRRPIGSPNFSGEKIIPTMEQYGAMVKLAPGVSLQEAYNNAFGPLAIQSPDSTAGIMSGLPQVPTPPGFPLGGGFPPGGAGPRIPIQPGNLGGAMIPEQGPLGPGLVGGTAPSTGMPQPINQPPMSPGELINPIKNTAPIQTPTEVPQPTNPVTGNTSPIGGSQQDFDAYMNSYVNDLINQRMKNVFGGIMSSFS